MFSISGNAWVSKTVIRPASVTWRAPEERRFIRARSLGLSRGLDGEEDLVRRAILDEAEGATFAATPTGPFVKANLDDARAALLQLGSYFLPGKTIGGNPPLRVVSPVGEDAVS